MGKNTNRIVLFLAAFVFLISSCQKTSTQKTSLIGASQGSKILKDLGDDFFKQMKEENLELRLLLGLRIEKLPEITIQKARSDSAFAASILERLKEVKVEDLSHEELLSLKILEWETRNIVEGLNFFWLSFSITPYSSPLTVVRRVFLTYEFKEKADLGHYLNLLEQYPSLIIALQNKLQEQYNKNIILPKEEFSLVVPFLSSFMKEGDQSLFYVKDDRLERIEDSEKKEFQGTLIRIIDSKINPAMKNLIDFIRGDYLKKAPDQVGQWQYLGGKEYYEYLIGVQTTLNLSPEEIHQIGLEEVQKINARVEEIRKSLGFKGTMAEFRTYLRSDPRFFPKTPEEIGNKLTSFVTEMSQKIDLFFLKKPRAPYGVKRLAPELEKSMTFGYYEPPSNFEPKGIYYFNGSQLDERSLLWAASLIYHELIPGHHFHFALQLENKALPDFRRHSFHTAFNEGWAEYAAWLGLEMGLYQDPYDLCGAFMKDLFLSSRLVVDTGMNYLKWPRLEATKYMRENLIESETQIESETLRYSVDMPAQALGYKLGSLKMFELRERAEKALGDKFDVRQFHDILLGSGSLPLPILEEHVKWYIDNELSKSKK